MSAASRLLREEYAVAHVPYEVGDIGQGAVQAHEVDPGAGAPEP